MTAYILGELVRLALAAVFLGALGALAGFAFLDWLRYGRARNAAQRRYDAIDRASRRSH